MQIEASRSLQILKKIKKNSRFECVGGQRAKRRRRRKKRNEEKRTLTKSLVKSCHFIDENVCTDNIAPRSERSNQVRVREVLWQVIDKQVSAWGTLSLGCELDLGSCKTGHLHVSECTKLAHLSHLCTHLTHLGRHL